MKNSLSILFVLLGSRSLAHAQVQVPKHEIGLTVGGLVSGERSGSATQLTVGSGTALQANYGYRVFAASRAAVYAEVHLLASPLRDVTSSDQNLTRNVATLFVTPGIRVKFLPDRRLAPYAILGAGWADDEQSTTTLAGRQNSAPRTVNHGAIDYGGGVDYKFWRFFALRAEVRDFYAGGPSYNTSSIRGGQHNLVAGGGVVLKFH